MIGKANPIPAPPEKQMIKKPMKMQSNPISWLLAFAFGVACSAGIGHGASEPLVALDAANLQEGPLTSWANTGSLKGDFKNDGTNPRVTVIDGAIASIRVYDRGFTTHECWNASGFQSAFLIAPRRGATVDGVTTTLKWEMGTPGVASYALHISTEMAQLELPPSNQAATKDAFHLTANKLTESKYGPFPVWI